jgi:hypothetical protein
MPLTIVDRVAVFGERVELCEMDPESARRLEDVRTVSIEDYGGELEARMVQQILETQEKGRQLQLERMREMSESEIRRRALKKYQESEGLKPIWMTWRGELLL